MWCHRPQYAAIMFALLLYSVHAGPVEMLKQTLGKLSLAHATARHSRKVSDADVAVTLIEELEMGLKDLRAELVTIPFGST